MNIYEKPVEAENVPLPSWYDDRTQFKVFSGGRLLVMHPDWPPQWIDPDGKLTPLELIGAELKK